MRRTNFATFNGSCSQLFPTDCTMRTAIPSDGSDNRLGKIENSALYFSETSFNTMGRTIGDGKLPKINADHHKQKHDMPVQNTLTKRIRGALHSDALL